MKLRIALALAVLGVVVSCDQSSGPAAHSGGSASTFATGVEEQCARTADAFAAALVRGDYPAAHALCSSHLRSRLSAEQIAEAERRSIAEFGKPTKVHPTEYVNTEADELAGPRHEVPGEDALDAAIRKISAQRAVGDIPDAVPVSIRRGSIVVEVTRDPRTIPNFEADTGVSIDQLTGDDMPHSYLTMVLVEEDGQMRVAHYWHRWPDIGD